MIPYIRPETLEFLEQLRVNNSRDWFQANKSRYEACVRGPALDLIASFAPRLASFAPRFRADAKKVGGSLMRPYRDTRFSHDKTPIKTNVGIQFRHDLGKDVHAPGYYLHIEPGQCLLGVGCWRPDSPSLAAIREAIDRSPIRWLAARDDGEFCSRFSLSGTSLVRPPKGYDKDHPQLEDLKRKDFIGVMPLADEQVMGEGLLDLMEEAYEGADPFMRFLCQAMKVPF
ncbi:conserved hypothetical protein [Ferrimonas balearica DSM 9799]|uniref:TIGR02453 family protein n=1 Tax=Ferrimonas balearica (strain DSM 9799 / CCM 4581 / KCTC 23876 / PAT) TaxID=550540 RepID=E1SVD7_FERBD|nr:DUF2461 domain-containing protein [Ferrimonas balearica]ADN74291.1 conserved hypothetical protein [Ferrimonas balearica DSM 9799]